MQKFSKSPAVLEAEKGGKFQMFDGNISGEYTELVSNLRLKESKLDSSVKMLYSCCFLKALWFLSELTET